MLLATLVECQSGKGGGGRRREVFIKNLVFVATRWGTNECRKQQRFTNSKIQKTLFFFSGGVFFYSAAISDSSRFFPVWRMKESLFSPE
jgi:hypothetical protein